ncbi:MAG: hypothetical protein KKB20_07755 [Proteobacteria bacterium]|nr:hypothetical protein [Pseudomonadota bacterium]
MNCQRCGDRIESGEEREHFGRTLCEDCYMDALSPARTCDPWAIHSARNLTDQSGAEGQVDLNEVQQRILAILDETGGIEPAHLIERLQVKPTDLEREIAALRHMEKLRGELRDGRRFVCLW